MSYFESSTTTEKLVPFNFCKKVTGRVPKLLLLRGKIRRTDVGGYRTPRNPVPPPFGNAPLEGPNTLFNFVIYIDIDISNRLFEITFYFQNRSISFSLSLTILNSFLVLSCLRLSELVIPAELVNHYCRGRYLYSYIEFPRCNLFSLTFIISLLKFILILFDACYFVIITFYNLTLLHHTILNLKIQSFDVIFKYNLVYFKCF